MLTLASITYDVSQLSLASKKSSKLKYPKTKEN